MVWGAQRPKAHPTAAATPTTSGNGVLKIDKATNAATASATSAGCPRARPPTRTTAWATITKHRRRDRGEHGGDDRGVPGAHVEGGQHQQGQHTRQHEQDSGDQAPDHPVQQPSDVDRQLLGLGPGQQGAEGKRVEKSLLPDPALLIDQRVLHHRDLPSGAAEGLQGDREPGTRCLTERNQAVPRGLVSRGGHWDFLPHRRRGAQPRPRPAGDLASQNVRTCRCRLRPTMPVADAHAHPSLGSC